MSNLANRLKEAMKAKEDQESVEYNKMSLEELGQVKLTKGEHKGQTFDWVWTNQISYVTWCAGHLQEKKGWKPFLMYIQKKTEQLEKEAGITKKVKSKNSDEDFRPSTAKADFYMDQCGEIPESASDEDDGWKEINDNKNPEKKKKPESSQELQELAQAVSGLMQMMQHLDLRLQGLESRTYGN